MPEKYPLWNLCALCALCVSVVNKMSPKTIITIFWFLFLQIVVTDVFSYQVTIEPRLTITEAYTDNLDLTEESEPEPEREEPSNQEQEWESTVQNGGSESMISFLTPTVTENPKDVQGFPKNIQMQYLH